VIVNSAERDKHLASLKDPQPRERHGGTGLCSGQTENSKLAAQLSAEIPYDMAALSANQWVLSTGQSLISFHTQYPNISFVISLLFFPLLV
jgi:hypothetical protein